MKDIIIHSDSIVAHVNAFGAELKGLSINGVEFLYDGDPEYYDRTSPTLFPITGRFLSDTYFVGEKSYNMRINGFALNQNFKVNEQQQDFVRFVLEDDERTRKQYPYAFKLLVEYRVVGNCIHITYQVENKGERELPFALGCHTAYRWPLFEGENPNDYFLRFEKDEKIESFNPFNWKDPAFISGKIRPLSHELFHNFARSITNIQSDWIEFTNRVNDYSIRIYRSEMPYLAIWTLADEKAQYICLEPCTSIHAGGCTTLYDRNGIIVMQPGECCEKKITIEIREKEPDEK